MIKIIKKGKMKLMKNKQAMTQMKAWFLILNIMVAIVAFSWMVSGETYTTVTNSKLPDFNYRLRTSDKVIQIQTPEGSWIDTNFKNIEDTNIWTIEETKVDTLGSTGAGPTGISGIPTATILTPKSTMKLSLGEGLEVNVQNIKVNSDGTRTITYKESGFLENTKTAKLTDAEYKKIIDDNPNAFDSKTEISNSKTKSTSLAENAALQGLMNVGMMFGLGFMIGGIIGDNADIALGAALATATFVWQGSAQYAGTFLEGPSNILGGLGTKLDILGTGSGGVIIGAIVFVLLYEKTDTEKITFDCLPFQPPVGGEDCELCNDLDECSEYVCKSLGQACELLNAGTGDEACTWVNPHDVTSPRIQFLKVNEGHTYKPDTSIRPPATGVEINQVGDECIEAFTALEFTIETDEPAQCKIDYNITREFDTMQYFVGQTNLFSYNHTEEMSLPSPSSINALSPEIQNDGKYSLFIRCQDANGNFNQDPYSVKFCVKKGPDTTPPRIVDLSLPSNSPINYNQTEINLEVYINEPAECRWSREDRDYAQMETEMVCATNVWEMNNKNVYTCATTLTGIKDRQDNEYYFRCKDQPGFDESDRNVNTQSYLYNLIGTQPLNIISIEPANETIKGSTDTLEVNLEVETDNGYKDGEAYCFYSLSEDEDSYIQFLETGSNKHTQRQDLVTGDYTYYIKCIDLGGNADYTSISFSVETDRTSPIVVRAYKESGELKIVTSEEADCSYSHTDCNFEIVDGIKMSSFDDESHSAEWLITKNYYIRCADEYNNQPDPNTCSIVVRPYKFIDKSNVLEL